jgi:hypothetical protein
MGYGPGMDVPFYPRVRGFGNAAPTTQAIPDRAPAAAVGAAPNREQTRAKTVRNHAPGGDAARLRGATRL